MPKKPKGKPIVTTTTTTVAPAPTTTTVSPVIPIGVTESQDSGWTVFMPSADSRIIYLSEGGNDNTAVDGDINHPYSTWDAALSRLRSDSPDWILTEKGTQWSGNINIPKSGRSATERLLLGTYGTGARPKINVDSTQSWGIRADGVGAGSGNFLAIAGYEIYAHERDPNSLTFNAATVDSSVIGIFMLSQFDWMLVEDCKISFCNFNLNIVPSTASGLITLRRNIITDAYGIDGGTNQDGSGMFLHRTPVILDGNLFDHNGWNETVTNAGRNARRHNAYIAGRSPAQADGVTANTGALAPVTARGNIFSRDASSSAFRSGGSLFNNLFIGNPYGHTFAAPAVGSNSVASNVYLEGINVDGIADSWGMSLFSEYQGDDYSVGTIDFSKNLLANSESATAIGIRVGDAGVVGVTADSNVFGDWGRPIGDPNGDPVSSSQVTDTNNIKNASAPGVTSGAYAGSIGLTATQADFLGACRLQAKGNYNPALTAAAANNYLRAGFGMSAV